jgi:hypothetical protein
MIHHPLAVAVVALVLALLLAIAALQGPLKSYVPDCSKTSFGFCYNRH